MGKESPGKRKTIFFNMDDPEQAKSFEFLETVRYQQSKFISKLIAEYRAKNHMTEDMSYTQVKENVLHYLDSGETSTVISEKERYAQDIADLVIEKLLESGSVVMKKDDQDTPVNLGETDHNRKGVEIEIQDESDLPQDGLSDMLSGFSAMIDS